MSDRDLEGNRPSVAIAKEICTFNLQVAEQGDIIIGRLLEVNLRGSFFLTSNDERRPSSVVHLLLTVGTRDEHVKRLHN
jgi:hypothetical protein